jgi:hypothetical protein
MELDKTLISDFISPVQKFQQTNLNDLEYQSYLKGRVLLITLFFLNNCSQELVDKQSLLQLMQNLANFKSGMVLHTAEIVNFIENHNTQSESDELLNHLKETSRAMSEGPSPRGSLVCRIVDSTLLH